MQYKILFIIFTFTQYFSIASAETLAYEKHGNSEVKVEKIGNSACTLTYKNADYLTTEGAPVFYSFQIEVNDSELQSGMHTWIPHAMESNKTTILSFYDSYDGKIYEYTGSTSAYGDIFYKTDLYNRFLNAKKITIKQGLVVKTMPRFIKSDIPNQVQKAFQECVTNLNIILQVFCSSSDLRSEQCTIKKENGKEKFRGLVVKDNPEVIAAAKALVAKKAAEKAKAIVTKKATEVAKVKATKKVAEAKNVIAVPKKEKETATNMILEATESREAIVAPESTKVPNKKYETKTFTIFSSKVQKPFKLRNYAEFGSISSLFRSDNSHGRAPYIRFRTNKGVVYFQSDEGIDYSQYKYLNFDFKLQKDPRDNGGFMIKMDCFYPCSSGNYPIKPPKLNSWVNYKINIQDLISQNGSSLDITNVDVPFGILPDWGNQSGVVFMIDNIILTN
tara:strand:- start:2775 stop:4115 length:1341 start_codon:yes stop_codon:yes gene_type:complete